MNCVLEGKVALVTGGGRGIGAAVALRLAQDGADVVLTFQQNQQRADDMVERIKSVGRRAIAVRADSADPTAVIGAVDRAAGELGRLDILVNNAGAFLLGPLELGHYARPADVAATVAFLASPEARYITGATVNVDGGFTI